MVATMPRVRSTEEVAVFRADVPEDFDVVGIGRMGGGKSRR
jgi:hypothetical protein